MTVPIIKIKARVDIKIGKLYSKLKFKSKSGKGDL